MLRATTCAVLSLGRAVSNPKAESGRRQRVRTCIRKTMAQPGRTSPRVGFERKILYSTQRQSRQTNNQDDGAATAGRRNRRKGGKMPPKRPLDHDDVVEATTIVLEAVARIRSI